MKILLLAVAISFIGCSSNPRPISDMSPLKPYNGPRLEGNIEIEVRIFPRVMMRPSEGMITIRIHGDEDKMPKCSGYKVQYERGFSSERLSCESPARLLQIPYHWRTYGDHKIVFLLFDLEKQIIASSGYGSLMIGVQD